MKTTTLKSMLLTLAFILLTAPSFSQNLIGTRIDVQGTLYSDQLWLFAVPNTTSGFDNGWDAYKMFGPSITPQIFAMESYDLFQINCTPDLNNTFIGFIAGVDTAYTFTFTHENLTQKYTQLYLVDSIANKTVDVFQTGSTYSFTAHPSDPMRRFKIITSLPVVPVVVDTTVVTPPVVTPPVVTPPVVTPPVVTPPVVVPPADPKNPKDNKGQSKKIKIYNSGKNIYIENPGKKGKMKLVNAFTGKTAKTADIDAQGTTIIKADVMTGSYVVNGVTDTDDESTVIVIP